MVLFHIVIIDVLMLIGRKGLVGRYCKKKGISMKRI